MNSRPISGYRIGSMIENVGKGFRKMREMEREKREEEGLGDRLGRENG
jgi:hypothetical protein